MNMTIQLATKHQWENFKIIGREGHGISRTIQEAIYIRVNNTTLNRNVGKYNLPHIWDKVLFTTPELKLNNTPLHLNICALEVKQLLVTYI